MGDPQNILGTANAINIGQKLLMMISKYILGTANVINIGQELLMMISKSENYIKKWINLHYQRCYGLDRVKSCAQSSAQLRISSLTSL